MYSKNFLELDLGRFSKLNVRTIVRRRKWIRRVIAVEEEEEEEEEEETEGGGEGGAMSEERSQQDQQQQEGPIPTNNNNNNNDQTEKLLNENQFQEQQLSLDQQPIGGGGKDRGDESTVVKDSYYSPSFNNTEVSAASFDNNNNNNNDNNNLGSADKSGVNIADNFEFDYEEDMKERESVLSDLPPPNSVMNMMMKQSSASASASTPPAASTARRSSWFGFGSSSAASTATLSSSPTTSGGGFFGQSASADPRCLDPALKVKGTTLTAIGKQIKFLEGECRKEDDARMKDFKDSVKPKLELRILELEKKVLEIKTLIEREVGKGADNYSGLEGTQKLEEQYVTTLEKLDAAKRELYFPYVEMTAGTNGVYLAIDDFWLEYASGSFFLEMCPNRKHPEINIKFFGTRKSEVDGVMARLKVEGFKLAGDKGKSIPKLKFDTLMVTIAFNFSCCLQYSVEKSKWFIDPKLFQVNILSFKGPYGLNRSIVALVISLLTPTIRSLILKNLPFELGLLVRTLSTPFTMEGEFDIKGINVRSLQSEFNKNDIFTKLCEYTPLQMEMFYWMQKSLERLERILYVF
jgi:hypothetical protein